MSVSEYVQGITSCSQGYFTCVWDSGGNQSNYLKLIISHVSDSIIDSESIFNLFNKIWILLLLAN